MGRPRKPLGICERHGQLPEHEIYVYPDGHAWKCKRCACELAAQRRRRKHGPLHGLLIPVERLQPIVRAELDAMSGSGDKYDILAERCGVNGHVIDKIARGYVPGRSNVVTLNVADQVLTSLGLNYLWMWPAERGGLADLIQEREEAASAELAEAA